MFASFLLYYDFNHRVVSHYPLIVEWFDSFSTYFSSKRENPTFSAVPSQITPSPVILKNGGMEITEKKST